MKETPNFDLENLSKLICKEYKIKSYEGYKLIEGCYDDFSYVISAKKDYFVKIFDQNKKEKDIQLFINKYRLLEDNLPNLPKIIIKDEKEVFKVNVENNKLYICVFEYLEGEVLKEVSKEDIDSILSFINLLKKVTIKETALKEEYSFSSLKENIKKANEYLPNKWNKDISKCFDTLKRIKYNELKKQTIHGNLQAENIIKANDHLKVVDFYQVGEGYRIIDIVKVIKDVIFFNKKNTIKLTAYFLEKYDEKNPLTEEEKKYLKDLIIADCYACLCLYRLDLKTKEKNPLLKKLYKHNIKVIKTIKKIDNLF